MQSWTTHSCVLHSRASQFCWRAHLLANSLHGSPALLCLQPDWPFAGLFYTFFEPIIQPAPPLATPTIIDPNAQDNLAHWTHLQTVYPSCVCHCNCHCMGKACWYAICGSLLESPMELYLRRTSMNGSQEEALYHWLFYPKLPWWRLWLMPTGGTWKKHISQLWCW
jgi:hypothetical protein